MEGQNSASNSMTGLLGLILVNLEVQSICFVKRGHSAMDCHGIPKGMVVQIHSHFLHETILYNLIIHHDF